MAFYRLVIASVLLLVSFCHGQEKVESILGVLNRAHVSGSIAYWSLGGCASLNHPPLPKIRPTNYSGSPLEALQEMFAEDPKMRVTQEPGGMVRMFETDAPTDLLHVKIHRVSFPRELFHGPNIALWTIMRTPEVQAFAEAHNIGPLYSNRVPGNPDSLRPQIHGELEDVTVSQALDYVLRTFPGYWIYGNCTNEGGGREVFFWFVENDPWKPLP